MSAFILGFLVTALLVWIFDNIRSYWGVLLFYPLFFPRLMREPGNSWLVKLNFILLLLLWVVFVLDIIF